MSHPNTFSASSDLNINLIRNDFPILNTEIYGKPMVYLDNAATTQKPQCVIDAIVAYYQQYNSNVHRGVHYLSQMATDAQEHARKAIQQFINAGSEQEIIFTKGTTDSINLIASSFCKEYVRKGDEIILSIMEHHSNIVPWQIACEQYGGVLKIIPMNDSGELDLSTFKNLISSKTKLVAVTWVSNALGTINPIKEIIEHAHTEDIPVLVDAAQSIQHLPVNVQDLDIDFLVFSGHKIYAPTGIGVLYGKEKYLDALPPYQGGGSMIKSVSFEKTIYADLPFKFEAGTPNIAGIIGLNKALEYVTQLGISNIAYSEKKLIDYAVQALSSIPTLNIIGGTTNQKAGAISFLINNFHPFDVGELLDKQGIAVRTGHHCCQPLMDYYQIPGTVRASFSFYNTKEEVDKLVLGIEKAIHMLHA